MRFTPLPLEGAYLIDIEPRTDDRGFFARLYCSKEMIENGLKTDFIQVNNSLSTLKGTLRGLHYQLPPAQEVKIVRCISGSLYDVILDLRPKSETFGKWYSTTLSADNRTMMYIPEGFAHGFFTLEPDTEILYFVTQSYNKDLERGIRWNDAAFSIGWPDNPVSVSERDNNHPDFDPLYHLNQPLPQSLWL